MRLRITRLCLQLLAILLFVCASRRSVECRVDAAISDDAADSSADGSPNRGHGGGGGSYELPVHHHNAQHGAGGSGRGGGGGGGRRGAGGAGRNRVGHRRRQQRRDDNDISLWINEKQLKMLSALFFPQGYAQGRIYAIEKGHVLKEIRDASIYKYLTIPAEVNHVNFTWKAASGSRKYFYHFDRLQTLDASILKAPIVSIETSGRIPTEEKDFSIFLPCTGNGSGTAMFNVGLSIKNRRGKALLEPLRMSFKKECAHRGPDPECQAKCHNGFCNHNKICQCQSGYTGEYCQTAFCFPACMNGGNCTAPSVCTCPDGYQGTQCEGGICTKRCQNGGKCVQKDKCHCSRGYYGLHCEYSKCVIPCKNGGRCVGGNVCRCPNGLRGDHCEIGRKQRSTCKRPCRHGNCKANKRCECKAGYSGRLCNSKGKKHRRNNR